jgi:hypothetical protein
MAQPILVDSFAGRELSSMDAGGFSVGLEGIGRCPCIPFHKPRNARGFVRLQDTKYASADMPLPNTSGGRKLNPCRCMPPMRIPDAIISGNGPVLFLAGGWEETGSKAGRTRHSSSLLLQSVRWGISPRKVITLSGRSQAASMS